MRLKTQLLGTTRWRRSCSCGGGGGGHGPVVAVNARGGQYSGACAARLSRFSSGKILKRSERNTAKDSEKYCKTAKEILQKNDRNTAKWQEKYCNARAAVLESVFLWRSSVARRRSRHPLLFFCVTQHPSHDQNIRICVARYLCLELVLDLANKSASELTRTLIITVMVAL